MRRLLLLLLLIVTTGGATAATADQQAPPWTAVSCSCDRANAIDAVDRQVLYLGTGRGVSRSDDGGFTWRPLPLPVTAEVTRVSFTDRDHGAAAGSFDGVLVTTDGGASWRREAGHLPPYRPGVLPADRLPGRPGQVTGTARAGSTVYAVGTDGLLARSTDGGTGWVDEQPPPSFGQSWFTAVDAVDADHAWVAVHAGRVLIRDPATAAEVTTRPHHDLGMGLLTLAGLAAAGALVVLASGRPAVQAAALGAVVLVAGASGALAVNETQTCRPSGCTDVLSLTDSPTQPAVPAEPSPRGTRVAPALGGGTVTLPSNGSSAAPGGSAAPSRGSAVPSGGSSSASGPGGSASTGAGGAGPAAPGPGVPAPVGTPPRGSGGGSGGPVSPTTPPPTTTRPTVPAPTATATTPPAPTGPFTVTPAQQDSACRGSRPAPVRVVLDNATGAPVTWFASARELLPLGGLWAILSDGSGTLAPGASTSLVVTPDALLCSLPVGAITEHVDVLHGGATTSVAVTVQP